MTDIVYSFNNEFTCQVVLDRNKPNILVSYYYLIKGSRNWLDNIREARKNVRGIFMLDSGAFSAWNSGKVISLFEYIDFIKQHHEYFTHIVCLDVINDPVLSEVNHLIMLDELKNYNLQIIPVFHAGESFEVLDYMITKGYRYIGISPNNNWAETAKRKWLSRVFQNYDFDTLGIKTHGFGYQSVKGLSYFPLTTADSNSWAMAAGYGGVVTPFGDILYSERTKDKINHINNIPGEGVKFVEDLCYRLGMTVDELSTDYVKRFIFNIESFEILCKDSETDISQTVELFLEGDTYGFSEKDVLDLYNKYLVLGRGCITEGIGQTIKKKVKAKRIEKELLF